MILSHKDLLEGWKRGRLCFNPDIKVEQIGLSSIDLRLGWYFTRLKEKKGIVIQPGRNFDPTDLVENQDFSKMKLLGTPPTFKLGPGEFRLAFTLEEITVPHNMAANVQGKSSLARSGLAVHVTAPHIHPGFSGKITLELYNHGPWTLELFPGQDYVCQLIFFKLTTPVSKKVAEALGTYVKQATPFPVRREESKEADSAISKIKRKAEKKRG